MEECKCDKPGYCEALGRVMPNGRWKECQSSQPHRDVFFRESQDGKYKASIYQNLGPVEEAKRRQALPPHKKREQESCIHLGGLIDRRKGDLCGCKVPQEVFGCAVHGECTKIRVMRKVKSCQSCEDRNFGSLEWAYGITTVPHRFNTHFLKTLESLKASGFNDPFVFVDGCEASDPYKALDLRFSMRRQRHGIVGNWTMAMWELYIENPFADRYALFQDDLICCKRLRAYLEQCPYPEKGYLNLYTARTNKKNRRGWRPSNQMGHGAVALVFNSSALEALIRGGRMFTKSRRPKGRRMLVDAAIIEAMRAQGFREFIHNPSLIQHTGLISSHGGDAKPMFVRSPNFAGEDFDAMSLLASGLQDA